MKRIVSFLLTVAIIIGTLPAVIVSAEGWDGTVATAYAGGDGSAESPYLISDAAELAYARQNINDGTDGRAYFRLTASIDYNNQEWVPMGTTSNPFMGTFDGNGYEIKNLTITQEYDYTGVFGFINMGTVKNLGISNLNVNANCSLAGGLVAHIHYAAAITDCYVKDSTIIDLSYGTSGVTGGVIGFIDELVTVKNTYAYNVKIGSDRGLISAFVGKASINSGSSIIENCYAADSGIDISLCPDSMGRYSAAYAFGCHDGWNITVTNCYSTIEDTDGSQGADQYNNPTPDNAMTIGVTKSATKESIEAGLVTNLADTPYAMSDEVNNGYPYIDYTKVIPTPTPAPTPTPTPTPTATPTPVSTTVPTESPDGWDGTVATSYADGDGSAESPYLISDAAELAYARQNINDGTDGRAYFRLTASIDCNNQEWVPMGTSSNPFMGTFDGNGYEIKNLTITQEYDYTGVFGFINMGTVKNLGISNLNVNANCGLAGGLVAHIHYAAAITDCYVKDSTIIDLSYGTSGVTGGIIGFIDELVTVKNTYAYNVKIGSDRGLISAFVGKASINSGSSIIENCYAADSGIDVSLCPDSMGRYSAAYAFGCHDGWGVTVRNCYSTIEDTEGSQGADQYNNPTPDNAMTTGVTKSATKESIEAGLITNLADTPYATSKEINNGYPYHKGKVEPTPTPAPTATPSPTSVPTENPQVTPSPTPIPSWNGTAATAYAGGRGTPANPYVISNAAELKFAAEKINSGVDNGKNFKLSGDIDFCDYEWVPLGTETNPFSGIIDGNGYSVKNLKISNKYDYTGFFGYVENALIKNFVVNNIYVDAECSYIGGFAGYITNSALKSCVVKNSKLIDHSYNIEYPLGGFVGCLGSNTTIDNSYAYGVKFYGIWGAPSATFFGALKGGLENVTLTNCYAAETNLDKNIGERPYQWGGVYAFGNTSGQSITLINCFSTTSDVEGTGGEWDYALVPSYSANVIKSADKNTIVSALVDDTDEFAPYAVNASINNGYPYCTFVDRQTADSIAANGDRDALSVPSSTRTAFQIETTGENGSTIRWESSNTEVVSINGNVANVYCGASDTEVILTATITHGDYKTYRDFTVTIKSFKTVSFVSRGITMNNNGDGTTTVSLPVTYTGIDTEKIECIVVVRDTDGKLKTKNNVVKNVADGNTSDTFNVSIPTPLASDTIEYYFWDDNGVSLIDNKPTAISNLKEKAKARTIKLTWDPSYDDSGNPVEYRIYRNDTFITSTFDTFCSVEGSYSEAYSFKVLAVDKNENSGISAMSAPVKQIPMHYVTATSSNGLERKENEGNDAYSVVENITNSQGTFKAVTSDLTTRNHYLYFKAAMSSNITKNDAELVFEIDYLDNGTDELVFVYNRIPEGDETDTSLPASRHEVKIERSGSGLWKTAVIRVDNAKLRDNNASSAAHFGIVVPYNTQPLSICIREVRLAKAEDYD